MPATSQLPKIADLVQRLTPLGGKQRGMPIEHDEWNTIVDVLRGMLEVDHAQEDSAQTNLEQRFALKDHDHLGQVTVAWLDPSLQPSLNAAGDGVTTRTAIAQMQQQVTALNTQLATLTQTLDQRQMILDQFAVNDVDRAKALSGFDARFAGVENLRTIVTGLDSQINGLTTNVNTVLDLRKSLSDAAGAPIDVAKIRQDVTALQGLATNLNGIDGTPVRLRDLQLKLNEVSDAVGVGGPAGLDGRLNALSTDLESRLNTKADEHAAALHDQLAAEQNVRSDQLKADVQASIKSATDALNGSTAASLKDSEARLTQSFTAQLTVAVAGVKTDVTASTGAVLDQRLTAVDDKIVVAVGKASTDLQASLQTSLSTNQSADVQAQVAAAETRLNGRIATDEANAQTFQTQLTGMMQTSIANSIATLGATLSTSVTNQVAQTQTDLQTRLDTQLATTTTTITAGLDPKIVAGIDLRLANLDARVSTAVTTALKTLPDQVGAAVDQRIAQADVAGQVQRSATSVTQQLRTEFTQAISDQQVRTTTAVNGVLTQVRGEMAVATKAAADDAVQRASTLVSNLRDEVNRNVKQQIDQVRTDTIAQITRGQPVVGGEIGVGNVHNIVIQPLGPG